MLTRSKALAVLALTLVSCSDGESASECRAAALVQAHAEDAYVAAFAAHEEQHASGNDTHPDSDDLMLAARVDLIIATEATRNACR